MITERNVTARVLICLIAISPSANALVWQNGAGNTRLSLDTTLSYGMTVRTQNADPTLIGISNGGHSANINGDDGDLNHKSGANAYSAVKVTQDFDASYKTIGFFTRYSWFYDFANMRRSELGPTARDRAGSEVELLDLYARGETHILGQPTRLRVGRQVVNWGESTFIPNGINVVNPVDLSKLRVPGADLKEALVPTPMAWLSQGITSNISVEGFAITDWNKVKTDPRGTFFSTDDALSDDGNRVYSGSGRRVDQHRPLGTFPGSTAAVFAPRGSDHNANDYGEYGAAARLFSPQLHNTEFSFYYMNYHSRTPFLSARRGGASVGASTFPPTLPGGCPSTLPYMNFPVILGLAAGSPCTASGASYFAEYPQNIHLYGFGFSTVGPWGIAIQGEHSYRPNQPVQLATGEIVLSAAGLATFITGAGNNAAAAAVPAGTGITGYRRLEVHQSQVSFTKVVGPHPWSNQTTAIAEVGYTHVNIPGGLFFAGPAATLAVGSNPGTGAAINSTPGEGYATKDSWGYRLQTKLDYFDVLGQLNIAPRISFSHDVSGVSSTFNQDVKSVSVGLLTQHTKQVSLDLSYTLFFGGRTYVTRSTPAAGQPAEIVTSANNLKDRDFFQATISYSF